MKPVLITHPGGFVNLSNVTKILFDDSKLEVDFFFADGEYETICCDKKHFRHLIETLNKFIPDSN